MSLCTFRHELLIPNRKRMLRLLGCKSSLRTSSTNASSTTKHQFVTSELTSSLVACVAGIVTVDIGSSAVEHYSSKSCPEFHPNRHRFDQTTFQGRYCTMILNCDPQLLLIPEEKCQKAKQLLSEYQPIISSDNTSRSSNEVYRSLWEAQRIVTAQYHPDTGNRIPAPFRMSGYVAFNGPVSVSMVASSGTTALLFWNWVNQSQNALVNYYNRNAASSMSNETMIKSYLAAVGSALCITFGLATLLQKRLDPAAARTMLRFVAFPSAVVASSINCYIVRSPEIDVGIPLLDDDNNEVLFKTDNKSIVAAKRAVYSTTLSRAVLPAPVFLLPPLLISLVQKRLPPSYIAPLTTYLIMVSFGLALPATVALFPQQSEIEVKELETKYHNLINPKTGKAYEKLYFNKGM